MFHRILVPVDGSKGSRHALHAAAEIAKRFEAEVHLICVIEATTHYPPGVVMIDADKGREWAQGVLDKACARLREEGILRCEPHQAEGHPAEAVLEVARKYGADLIVMGTHGRRGFDRRVMGSVAEEVVRLSPVPVTTVHLDGGAST